ncbi:ABC-F family ATP-binding cassette domain-containing protein [Candidatus Symbiobacter mobilis]|uniref:Probable ATP-binding protein YheS n=1 Tax=Candidatus Symbiobacter mobilis CR TaxID=946483 RepID=U5N5W2_9BURK|nr:ATP-binding cassette domain-containing protein [Candidatus Symbiobacter mobilis]AGX86670.1 subfamily F ATP-binding cassette [Candidatus Symbiobacter mobilis CR]
MLRLQDLTVRRGGKVLLSGANLTIWPGEKVALVGRNGSGKSTLFALWSGAIDDDGGECTLPPHWRVVQVAQELPDTDQPATEYVIDGDAALLRARQEVQAAEASHDGVRLAHALAALHDAGTHDAPARAQALLLGLGFRSAELGRSVSSFSGGWRMRLQLARALICPSDLLLLDEPTNHLDLDALVWLETWLQRYAGTLVVISHDREFLDAVTAVTVHIDNAALHRYGGNYSTFETLRSDSLQHQQAAYSRQQEEIARMQRFIDRFQAKATKARQAQSRVKALERMQRIAPVLAESELRFSFAQPTHSPNPMLKLDRVDCGYAPATAGDGADPDESDIEAHPTAGNQAAAPTVILRGVGRTVLPGQRVGILGANGQGKSTLVKTIVGVLAPLDGRRTEGKGLRIGYFAQSEVDVLRLDDSPLEHLLRLRNALPPTHPGATAREQDLRNVLGTFQFCGDMVHQSVGSMSGGEKARLVLCMIVWQRPNLLLLDEPTNHLDLTAREALAVALNDFSGALLLVSHDRALLRAVCDEFWLVADGQVSPFDGDIDDYQRYVLDRARADRAPPRSRAARPTSAVQSAKPSQPSLQTLQRRLAAIEARVETLRQQCAALESQLLQSQCPTALADLGTRLQQTQEECDTAEEEWLELSCAVEEMGG